VFKHSEFGTENYAFIVRVAWV